MESMTALKKRVPLVDVLSHYKVKLDYHKGEMQGRCPICEGSGFKANPDKNVWKCFSCKDGGNLFDFVAKKELCDVKQAAAKIYSWFSDEPKENKPIDPIGTLDPEKTPFEKETAEYFEGGYCKRGTHKGRVAAPIHNLHGELVSYAGLGDDVKYHRNYTLGIDVYNLHRLNSKWAIVCKDIHEVWEEYENGRPAIALLGEDITTTQLEALKETSLRFMAVKATVSEKTIQTLVPHFYVRHFAAL